MTENVEDDLIEAAAGIEAEKPCIDHQYRGKQESGDQDSDPGILFGIGIAPTTSELPMVNRVRTKIACFADIIFFCMGLPLTQPEDPVDKFLDRNGRTRNIEAKAI